jgi:uncharacterized protein YfkK (UPF0435 family)
MDLSVKSDENVQYMIEEIKKKLKMATGAAIKPTHFGEDQYEDIRDIYELIMNKNNISISEMEAIVSELGRLKRA